MKFTVSLCVHQHPRQVSLPGSVAASAYVPSMSHRRPPHLQETLQDQQVGLAKVLSNYCFCFGHVGFSVGLLKGEISVSPSPVGVLKLNSTGLQSLAAHLPCARPLGKGPRHGAQDSCFFRKNLCNIILQFVSHTPGHVGLEYAASLLLLSISSYFLLDVVSFRSFLTGSSLSHRWLFCRLL